MPQRVFSSNQLFVCSIMDQFTSGAVQYSVRECLWHCCVTDEEGGLVLLCGRYPRDPSVEPVFLIAAWQRKHIFYILGCFRREVLAISFPRWRWRRVEPVPGLGLERDGGAVHRGHPQNFRLKDSDHHQQQNCHHQDCHQGKGGGYWKNECWDC